MEGGDSSGPRAAAAAAGPPGKPLVCLLVLTQLAVVMAALSRCVCVLQLEFNLMDPAEMQPLEKLINKLREAKLKK